MRPTGEARTSWEERADYLRRRAAATGNRWWEYEAAKQEAENLSSREADVYLRRIADELGI